MKNATLDRYKGHITFFAAATVFALTLFTCETSYAGHLFVDDVDGHLQRADVGRLTEVAQNLPFDLMVIIDATQPSEGAFIQHVERSLTGPRALSVGIDPKHHFTSIAFGGSLGIPRSEWVDIRKSGNSYFKARDFAGGFSEIARSTHRALMAAEAGAVMGVPASKVEVVPQLPASKPEAQPHSDGSSLFWATLFIFFAIIGIGTYLLYRQRQYAQIAHARRVVDETVGGLSAITSRDLGAFERANVPAPRTQAATGNPPPPPTRYYSSPSPPPQTVVVQDSQTAVVQDSSSNLITGLMLGQMMAKPSPTPAPRSPTPPPRAPSPPPRRASTPPRSSYGSWSSDSSSSGGWDSGGDSGGSSSGGWD